MPGSFCIASCRFSIHGMQVFSLGKGERAAKGSGDPFFWDGVFLGKSILKIQPKSASRAGDGEEGRGLFPINQVQNEYYLGL